MKEQTMNEGVQTYEKPVVIDLGKLESVTHEGSFPIVG